MHRATARISLHGCFTTDPIRRVKKDERKHITFDDRIRDARGGNALQPRWRVAQEIARSNACNRPDDGRGRFAVSVGVSANLTEKRERVRVYQQLAFKDKDEHVEIALSRALKRGDRSIPAI